ncbi:protein gprM [Aspergillus lucknowensis]|uniref:G-protein coupled receptors family 2 profile 2 domain-containing protein n=1 Tax=Aspergillus lucknowensis TaxID=176173 RepID=A0ABR4LRH5_9EURO
MSENDLRGACPPPYYQEDLFDNGGFVGGRFCQNTPTAGNASCCLPCPQASWLYGEEIQDKIKIASWVSVAVLPLCVFLLVSYAVLPAKRTHRHYLSICFTLGIGLMQIAFIIPLGTKPDQCYNEITPNDMYSSLSCAFTGSILLFGGWVVVVFSFIRTIAFHLQVCWEVILGPKFMWGALICGLGIPIIGTSIMLVLTGVSFRFGDTCHINIEKSLQDYWIPLISFAGASLIMQFTTMGYCVHVYIKSLYDPAPTTNSSNLQSYTASVGTLTARQAYRRVRKIFKLQWRSNCVVLVILANVIIFAIIFIRADKQLKVTPENLENATPWLLCLGLYPGDRTKCFDYAKDVGPSEATLLALLFLLTLVGFWNFLLFARPSMFVGWLDLFRRKETAQFEFVSADARKMREDAHSYEMLSSNGLPSYKSPEPFAKPYVRSPSPAYTARTLSPDLNNHYGRDARYVRPSMSFSGPRPPSASQNQGRDWDPEATFARAYPYSSR